MEYIFITGFGRSGTTLLSKLLDKCSEAKVYHEYVGNREFELLCWYLGRTYSKPFLQRAKKLIELESHNTDIFIDVNGGYRNCIEELVEVFKPLEVLHLVRDPRDVIRSLFTRRDDKKVHFLPTKEREIEWWLESDLLELEYRDGDFVG